MVLINLFVMMILLSACSTKQKDNSSNKDMLELSWNTKTENHKENGLSYSFKKSSDGLYCWITKVEVLEKNQSDKLIFPKKIKDSVLLRIGFDKKGGVKQGSDTMQNVFGSSLEDDFRYPTDFLSVQNIVIPDSVQSIEDGAFTGLYSLKRINCPKDLKHIGIGAFSECSGLNEFEIGEKVSEIGQGAFSNCKKLKKISVSEHNKNYYEQGGFIIDKSKKQAVFAIPGRDNFILSEDIKSFGKYCFDSCIIKRIDLKNEDGNLVQDGNYIYLKSNKSLLIGVVTDKKVVIPNGVEELNTNSILVGKSVTRIEMPSSLKRLRGEWMDMITSDKCTFVFNSKIPPSIVEPSKTTSMVPIGQKIIVPPNSISRYKKWVKKHGGILCKYYEGVKS